ncbi:related to Galactose oxidase [Cephalotrichum gorgonifer]|uniref:Related to Galactose oxidase n=1 Tax=Cephalotrichum gorgonifer TaxID=2041049 RepID=A0AAE8N3A8_9PEZI|nr:related to Galactose oxidase [Cephalotrichum gorgonifer]
MHLKSWSLAVICLQALGPTALAQNLFPWANVIPRGTWTATSDSEQPGNEAQYAIDDDSTTIWHTPWEPDEPFPHWIQVDMGQRYVVSGISYTPRQDSSPNGNIARHEILLSDDGENWSQPVAYGEYLNDKTTKTSFFVSRVARHVRLVALSEGQDMGYNWTSVADFSVYTPDVDLDPDDFEPPDPASQGQWETTIDFPLVPASGAHARDGTFVFWAASRPDDYPDRAASTETIEWNPFTAEMTHRTVSETNHDMFCPGISMDAEGLVIVTGGNDNKKTSIYNPDDNQWTGQPDMSIGRGYQSQTLLSDGRTWTIGGSWSGPKGGKNGEIWNGSSWTALPGCEVKPMLTDDVGLVWRSDNHGWLFAWTNSTIFQAGPSKAMHWYGVSDGGSVVYSSNRGDDGHAMCGMSAMYDAVEGKILTLGGAPNYEKDYATSNANLVQIGTPNSEAQVKKLPNMSFSRSFGNAVVLPDGKVFIVGGQSYAVPFSDENAALPCELFDPDTESFTVVASIAVARVYHSIALLLSDGTVISGGGGLCGKGCKENHLDAQIWSPPYLFNSDGSRAKRPTIISVSPPDIFPGDTLVVETDTEATFSLVRYGTATHGVNTDQRRVPLSGSSEGNTYTLETPDDPGKLLPGYWMLFAISSAGVPSMAETVKVLV